MCMYIFFKTYKGKLKRSVHEIGHKSTNIFFSLIFLLVVTTPVFLLHIKQK